MEMHPPIDLECRNISYNYKCVNIQYILEINELYYKKNKSFLEDNVCTFQALFVTKPLHYIDIYPQDTHQ